MQVLLEWRANPEKKSLIVSGARQIGKTYLIRQFASENYDSWIELNFLEDSSLKDIFSGALNADSILTNIRLFRPQGATPETAGEPGPPPGTGIRQQRPIGPESHRYPGGYLE